MDQGLFLLVLVIAAVAFTILVKTAIVVPQQSAFIVERLGKYSSTLSAGFHILVPFLERVAYRHNLKESAVDIPEQICITKDNVQVGIDGVLYLQVLDAARASYGISDHNFAISQLAQTTLRSEIGKIDLDRTFEERATINANVVSELDKASEPWGVKVLRYEIKNINPPRDVIQAMEKQMRAEREKRAVILTSEGDRDAKINQAEGEKQRVIKESEAARQQQINEAAGEAEAILAVATATAEGLRRVAEAVATARIASASPAASLICCCRTASDSLMTRCFSPSAWLILASRSPSDVSTTARFSRSARICFSIAWITSRGGLMFLIS
jgi:regulator of protease activity HflC (stomatin/prohibitin superfamily)